MAGNVRELENVMERSVLLADGEELHNVRLLNPSMDFAAVANR